MRWEAVGESAGMGGEAIVANPAIEVEISYRGQLQLAEAGQILRLVTNQRITEQRFRSLLVNIDMVVIGSGGERQPIDRPDIGLIFELKTAEHAPGGAGELNYPGRIVYL